MTKEENEALRIKWNKLENDIIEEVSKLDNDKLMNMFLDWMNIRNQLNEDWLKFWNELMEKVQAKNLQQPDVIKSVCDCEEKDRMHMIDEDDECTKCGEKF